MHMFWKNFQNNYFYSVSACHVSNTSRHQITILLLLIHFVPVLRYPLKVPDRYSDAVRPPFIFLIAHAKFLFHFVLRASALSRPQSLFRTRKLSLQLYAVKNNLFTFFLSLK